MEPGLQTHRSLRSTEAYRLHEEEMQAQKLLEMKKLRRKRLKDRLKNRLKNFAEEPSEEELAEFSFEGASRPKRLRIPNFSLRVLRYTANPALIKANKHLILSSDWENVTKKIDSVKSKIVSLFWTNLEKNLLLSPKPNFTDVNLTPPTMLLDGQISQVNYPRVPNIVKPEVKTVDHSSLKIDAVGSQDSYDKVTRQRGRPLSCGLVKVNNLAKAVNETLDLIRSCKINLKKL
jgi:hypothetical protein